MNELLRDIRSACSARTWSRGVELARSGAVVGVSDAGDEVELRVTMGGGVLSPLVCLYPEELEWDCECKSREDACMHVAAAAIALKQLRQSGEHRDSRSPSGPQPSINRAPAAIAYRLSSQQRNIALTRVVQVDGEDDRPIQGSLKQAAQRLNQPLITTEADLQFERRFGTVGGGRIAREHLSEVFKVIADVERLTFDLKPITLGPPTSGLCVRITEVGDDLHAQLEQDPNVDRIFENGALVRADILSPLGEHGLSVPHFRRLRKGWTFPPEERGTLAGDLIPRWRRTVPVMGQTDDLPQARTMAPRLQIATTRIGHELEVLATIVYGDPAVARLDGERLTLLRQGGTAPIRNARLEAKLHQQLRALQLEPGVRRRFPPGEAMDWRARVDRSQAAEWHGHAHEAFYEAGALEPQLQADQGVVNLWFEVGPSEGEGRSRPGQGARVDATAVMHAWEQGAHLVPLMDGGFGRLPTDWLSQHAPRVLALLRAKQEREDDDVGGWAIPDVAALCHALEQPPPPAFEGLRALVNDDAPWPEITMPADLQATLRDYQRTGVQWLSLLRQAKLGALLADDMGLGKTLQALCAIEGRTLVVAPTSVLPNWAKEAQRFRPSLRTSTYHGAGRQLDPDADLTFTTYALLRLDIEQLEAVPWDTVVLDEAQAIKNPDSQVARAAFRLHAPFRIAMTGTPVENRLDDLWSQMHFTNPGLLGGRTDFQQRYVRTITGDEGGDDQARAATLRARIRPFILRRHKREVARELPPRTDVVLYCELSTAERELYDSVRAATHDEVTRRLGAGQSVFAVLEALLRLRQASCHPALVPGALPDVQSGQSAKLDLLQQALQDGVAGDHKALVFSQWTSLLDRCETMLRAAELPFVRLDGSTRDRGAVVDRFQDHAGPPVMLISLRAGGTGLNLTAADHVFLLDPWWNPAVEDQAADRAHRIGQENPVVVHRLVARDTVEERILALQQRKRALAEAAVGDGGSSATASITQADLLALLE